MTGNQTHNLTFWFTRCDANQVSTLARALSICLSFFIFFFPPFSSSLLPSFLPSFFPSFFKKKYCNWRSQSLARIWTGCFLDNLHRCLLGIPLYHRPKKFFHLFPVLEPLILDSMISGFGEVSPSFPQKRCIKGLKISLCYLHT